MLLLVGNGIVSSYDPKKGDYYWECAGLGEVSGNTATTSPTMIFASSGYPKRNLIALKADGSVAWKKEGSNEFPYPPTMLWHNDHLYIVSDQGTIVCYQSENGRAEVEGTAPRRLLLIAAARRQAHLRLQSRWLDNNLRSDSRRLCRSEKEQARRLDQRQPDRHWWEAVHPDPNASVLRRKK